MRPLDCPEFEYDAHPRRAEILPQRQEDLYTWIAEENIKTTEAVTDSRPFHLHLFEDLCPAGCSYYAGHYRGEPFRCLREYDVKIDSDPLVGTPSRQVAGRLAELAVAVRAGIAALDEAFRAPKAQVPEAQRALYAVAFACRVFVEFLTIHPYANGNGHIARFCLTAILERYGLALTGWSIDPSPNPPYDELIYRHRRGEPQLLERVVLQKCKPI